MWVITTRGFFSAVEKPEDRADGMLTVRARNKADIYALAQIIPGAEPYRLDSFTDYEWRLRCTAGEWATALARLALEIDYSNFKTAVGARQGKKRAGIYSRVWSALLSLEDRGRKGGYGRGYTGGSLSFFDDQDPPTARRRRR